jgi:NAD(P)H-dependent FMN reductase
VITVVIATNRKDSVTSRVAHFILQILNEQNMNAQLLDLGDLPSDFLNPAMYGQRSNLFMRIFNDRILNAQHLLFVIPEYNGSYPGVLKLFLDASPVRELKDKSASIIGLSDGHAGNMRGQDHLTGVLHYLKMHVHYHMPKLSGISKAFDSSGNFTHDLYMTQLREHIKLISEQLTRLSG